MRNRRRRIWIDRLQTRLFLRMVMYCVLLLAGVLVSAGLWIHFLTFVESTTGSRQNFVFFTPMILAFLMLVPIFIVDMVRYSHRFAGPLYRFRQTIKAIIDGDEVPLVHLRKGDLMMEMQDEFNEMLLTLEQRGLIVVKHTNIEKDKQEVAAPVGS